mmetsp:Transcript_24438/g.78839  ORF Transcript_24438/g.78839 Transcript_24438/m.78839 type:complete len:142 (-) Transcript_24438:1803-2228(-)
MACRAVSCLYMPARAMSSSCVPCSTILPLETTQMESAARMVDRRWATTTVVRWVMSRSIAFCTTCSDSESSAEVASSRSSTFGSTRSARAMAMRCFCPPDSWTPRSPTSVSKPCSNESMKASALAVRAAVRIAASSALGHP